MSLPQGSVEESYYLVISMRYPCLAMAELEGLLPRATVLAAYHGVLLLKGVGEDELRDAVESSALLKEAGRVVAIGDVEDWRRPVRLEGCHRVFVAFKRLGGEEWVRREDVLAHVAESLGGRERVTEWLSKRAPRGPCALTVLVTEGLVVYGVPVVSGARSHLYTITPQQLPYYAPGALNPWFARALSNMAGRRGRVFVDPFCGTGSIPVWTASSFELVLCGDIEARHCEGALANYATLHGLDERVNVVRWDYAHLPLREGVVDAMVTDLPYGRSTKPKGSSEEGLLLTFFNAFHRYLRRGGVAVVSLSGDMYHLSRASPLDPERACPMYVHGRLSRVIARYRRPEDWSRQAL